MQRDRVELVVLQILRHPLLDDEDLLAQREAGLTVGGILGDTHHVRRRGQRGHA
ncbi:MAG: hypothetical protein JF621_26425 [Streptomyces turgidiscabies]|nr:hypothetical protein [Streptomyces turgidiscabies]